ncbi:MAG: hypothetical protein HOE48_19865 [Candidatus Latescibacteria bacterium]|nr:hypothetical protein [Candidatus Latescibacterota bacterium]MBT4140184.1 hypothetical protein [Candidatus Latescibacterota bacterium]MBT5828722.1 hypothetical protein [Candidatus Latescibacterota bacterium]
MNPELSAPKSERACLSELGACLLQERTPSGPSGDGQWEPARPAWSPDGRSLFINSAHPGHAQVYRVDVE